MKLSKNKLILQLFLDFFNYNPLKLSITLSLIFFRSLTAGIGLLLILPLLEVIGLKVSGSAGTDVVHSLQTLLSFFHIPLTLISVLLCYIVIVSIIAITSYFESVMSSALQQYYIHHLRTDLYRQLLNSRWQFFISRKVSDMLHTVTTQVQWIANSTWQLMNLISNLVITFIYVILAFLLSWPMTLVALGFGVLLLLILLPLHKITLRSGENHLKNDKDIFQSISEQLNSIKMIKGSGQESNFVKQTLDISTSLEKENLRITKINSATQLVYAVGTVGAFSFLFYIAITFIKVSIDDLLLLLIVFSRLMPKVSSLQQTYQMILHGLPAFKDVKDFDHDCKQEQENKSSDQSPILLNEAISIQNLSFHYHENKPSTLKDFTARIAKNQTTGIIGPSGIGKSTLADLIAGLLAPNSGTIHIDQTELTEKNRQNWRKSIAYVTQEVLLLNDTIKANIKLFAPLATDQEIWTVLEMTAADRFVRALDHKLDTLIGERGIRLSGGERQRIALARALLTNPQLLILDESTSSLDKENVQKIQRSLKQLHGQTTILVISHQKEMLAFTDHTIDLTDLQTHNSQ